MHYVEKQGIKAGRQSINDIAYNNIRERESETRDDAVYIYYYYYTRSSRASLSPHFVPAGISPSFRSLPALTSSANPLYFPPVIPEYWFSLYFIFTPQLNLLTSLCKLRIFLPRSLFGHIILRLYISSLVFCFFFLQIKFSLYSSFIYDALCTAANKHFQQFFLLFLF